MSRQARMGAVILAVAVSIVTGAASATVLEEVPLEDMILQSDAIVYGVVVSTSTRLVMGQDDDEGGAEPHTLTTVRVLQSLKGHLDGTVTIRERGGATQGGGMWIAGTPRYTAGEEVIVFLERWSTRPNDLRTFGMVQGKFRVRHSLGGGPAAVERDLDGVGFAAWANDGTMTVEHREAEAAAALGTFLSYIETVLDGGGR